MATNLRKTNWHECKMPEQIANDRNKDLQLKYKTKTQICPTFKYSHQKRQVGSAIP